MFNGECWEGEYNHLLHDCRAGDGIAAPGAPLAVSQFVI